MKNANIKLTGALEDYLETIYELRQTQKVVRIKEIAKAREVRAASVSPAMKRLADLGLITYEQREYIDLTPEGEVQARKVYARHQMLSRFFEEVLALPHAAAVENACSMEHSLTPHAMDHLVRFFEFLRNCPEGKEFLSRFHGCERVQGPDAGAGCAHMRDWAGGRSLADLQPSDKATVTQVLGQGPIRQRLLDMGILPGTKILFERVAPAGDPIWIKVHGFALSLRRKEAEQIKVA